VPKGSCPGPNDPRVPTLQPFESYTLNADSFFAGDARYYSWSVLGGPCDQIAPTGNNSFTLLDPSRKVATFVPRLSGDYTVSLTVQALSGEYFQCDWVVPVRGPGLRIEMCYPESNQLDLDLFLKRLSTRTPWYTDTDVFTPNLDVCGWHDCEATLRGNDMHPAQDVPRADWGYAPSDLSECVGGPLGSEWAALGYCANPRLDIDNNLLQGAGLPENINLDNPREGDGFRIMVQNFSGSYAEPMVNVYCDGARTATFGAPPDSLWNFTGSGSAVSVGAMWRVADVVAHRAADGSLSCTVTGLHPAGLTTGYFVTNDDPTF